LSVRPLPSGPVNDENLGHRMWGWIGREFGAPLPDPEDPHDIVPILEAAPTERVQVLAAQLVANDIAAFVAKCGPLGQVIVPWPTTILGDNWVPFGQNRLRANLYVLRGQRAEAEALIAGASPTDAETDQVP
jgi:hypothetical protein